MSTSNTMEHIQHFNFDLMIPTLGFFIIGLIYYFYKYRVTRRNLENLNLNQRNNSNINRNSQNYSFNNTNNVNNNDNNNVNNIEYIRINILLLNETKSFTIDKNLIIGEFIRNFLLISINNLNDTNQTISLICQGRRLDENKKFSEYQMISNNTAIHCFISNVPRNSQQDPYNNSNIGNNGINPLEEDENAVSIHTIIFHFIVFIFILILFYLRKSFSDLIPKGPLLLFQIMVIIWITQVSKCIAKVVIHKKIIYN